MQFAGEGDKAFDLWLTRSLAGQYALALLEDVPCTLLALLEGLPPGADAGGPPRCPRDCAGSC